MALAARMPLSPRQRTPLCGHARVLFQNRRRHASHVPAGANRKARSERGTPPPAADMVAMILAPGSAIAAHARFALTTADALAGCVPHNDTLATHSRQWSLCAHCGSIKPEGEPRAAFRDVLAEGPGLDWLRRGRPLPMRRSLRWDTKALWLPMTRRWRRLR